MKFEFKYLYITILFLITCVGVSSAQVSVSAKIDKPTMLIGEQTKLHLSITFPAKDTVGFPHLADSLVAKVQILNIGKPDTTFDKNDLNKETIHRSYLITSFDTGQYVIPQYVFHTKSGDIKTNEVVLTIKSVAVDTTKGIYDIKQPFKVDYGFIDWLRDNWKTVAGTALALLAILAGIYFWLKRPKKPVEAKPEVKPLIPADIEAINQLNALREQKLWQADQVKEYHSELTDIIRQYLEKRYGIKAHEQTSDEIFTALRYMDIDDDSRNKLRQILLLADLVKFAKQKPLPAENEQSIENAIAFVMNTKKQVQLNQDKGEGNNELV
ncbi:hypothetical protein BEL04_02660 [Mucilaginibacter sp. PPCGB 2223]|uniref:hypothetical protein n=1 Tax=Mucilaginibacter sp. PPCGB 2223 TaxID=1886027 RepID=UPI00082535E0|nr:hypothetical protein [Mucilaginibacter sp. PPCGB 2223]OCX53227.1 hypothetical protein BEL04_02660 [Mucilaginibacter sp. PPCGB 2223]